MMCIMLSGILACVPGTLNSEMREFFQILVRKGRTTVHNGKHCICYCIHGTESSLFCFLNHPHLHFTTERSNLNFTSYCIQDRVSLFNFLHHPHLQCTTAGRSNLVICYSIRDRVLPVLFPQSSPPSLLQQKGTT